MINIAICDDDKLVVANIENMIMEFKQREFEYDIFFSGEDILSYMRKNRVKYDIYFLDIEMNEINGQMVAKEIRKNDLRALIVFITTHTEFIEAAFDVQAFHFLSKPIDKMKFRSVIENAFQYLGDTKKVLTIKNRKRYFDIFCDEIIFFESNKRKIIAYTIKESYEFYMSMKDVLQQVDGRFFVRVHGSYIVNVQHILEFRDELLLMVEDYKVPISRNYTKNLKSAYREYVRIRI